MTTSPDNLFRRASLERYPWNKRLLIHVADVFFYWVVKILGSTARFRLIESENLDVVTDAGKVPIYAFWHDQIMLATYFYRDRGVVIMTSKSFDGEYIARFITRFGYGAIRGSSSKGGSAALIKMIRAMTAGHPMGFTIDGPRGPRHKVKPGPILLAKRTGNPVFPGVVEPRH